MLNSIPGAVNSVDHKKLSTFSTLFGNEINRSQLYKTNANDELSDFDKKFQAVRYGTGNDINKVNYF